MYTINRNNNLVIIDKNKRSIIYGHFVYKDDCLLYMPESNEPAIRFEGSWSIDKNHNLVFYINNKKDQKLYLKTSVFSTQAKQIVFSIETRIDKKTSKTSLIKFYGNWKVTAENRLSFYIKKNNAADNPLTFKGQWKIGKDYEITYIKDNNEILSINGSWQILDHKTIEFLIENNLDNKLIFRASIGTKNIYAKKGEIKYRIGILINKQNRYTEIGFFGTWKFSNKLGLYFQIKKSKTFFNIYYNFANKDKISLSLYTKKNKDTGLIIVFTKNFFKNTTLFTRFKTEMENYEIVSGISISF
ncbi:MAG: hypothetical protein ABIF12_01075 [bacterium]